MDSHSGHLVPTQWPPRWYIFCKKPTQNPTFFPPSINPSTRSSINTSIHEVLGHLTGLVALQYHHLVWNAAFGFGQYSFGDRKCFLCCGCTFGGSKCLWVNASLVIASASWCGGWSRVTPDSSPVPRALLFFIFACGCREACFLLVYCQNLTC